MNKSASGKHGHTKCNFVAVDIISGKTYEDIIPETHLVDVPKLERYNYLGDFMLEGVHMASADQGFNGAICGNVEMPNENLGLEQGDVVSAVTSAVSGRVKIVKKEMNYRR